MSKIKFALNILKDYIKSHILICAFILEKFVFIEVP